MPEESFALLREEVNFRVQGRSADIALLHDAAEGRLVHEFHEYFSVLVGLLLASGWTTDCKGLAASFAKVSAGTVGGYAITLIRLWIRPHPELVVATTRIRARGLSVADEIAGESANLLCDSEIGFQRRGVAADLAQQLKAGRSSFARGPGKSIRVMSAGAVAALARFFGWNPKVRTGNVLAEVDLNAIHCGRNAR